MYHKILSTVCQCSLPGSNTNLTTQTYFYSRTTISAVIGSVDFLGIDTSTLVVSTRFNIFLPVNLSIFTLISDI
ncbi:hypothetical protein KSS87_011163, partial [Heliosperma pusillum]